jgi:DNA repair protein RadC
MRQRASLPSSYFLTEQTPLDFTLPPVTEARNPFQVAERAGWYRTTRPVSEREVVAFSCELLAAHFERDALFESPTAGKPYFIIRLAERLQEVFAVAFLDNRHRLIAYEELFFGTIDGCSVHPREVVRRALFHNAAAVIFAHNHPSGFPEPSCADQAITARLKEALALFDVRVLDHLIVGGGDAVSLAERGML